MIGQSQLTAPNQLIRDEMRRRHWDLARFARAMKMTEYMSAPFLRGEVPIDDVLANKLSVAFDTSVQFWLNLQAQWDLSQDGFGAGIIGN